MARVIRTNAKWYRKFRSFREKGETSEGITFFPENFRRDEPFHLNSPRNFRVFHTNGKRSRFFRYILPTLTYTAFFPVVYHLHGQTAQPTVWANGKPQNLGVTGKFRSSISFTICTNQFLHLPKNRREGTQISVWNIPSRKTGPSFFKFSSYYQKFSRGTPDKSMFHLHPNRNYRNFLVNVKHPEIPLLPEIFR